MTMNIELLAKCWSCQISLAQDMHIASHIHKKSNYKLSFQPQLIGSALPKHIEQGIPTLGNFAYVMYGCTERLWPKCDEDGLVTIDYIIWTMI